MINQKHPKLNLYTKNQLANAIRGNGLSFHEATALIEDCRNNKNKYWSDNIKESDPSSGKWVRNASGSPLGQLLERINQRILAPHDGELPPFIYGGVGEKGIRDAAAALQGKKNKRILLKIDMRRFFEHVSYADIEIMLIQKCHCGKEAARIIAEMACIEEGEKTPTNKGQKVLARGFSTSSRLAVWCNLNLFKRVFYLVAQKLKGHDPRIAIYMDDIGITASRVNSATMSSLYKDILELIEASSLEINENKTMIIDYLRHEYDATDGSIKEGAATQFEFLGIGMGRSHLYPGAKIRSKISRARSKECLSEAEQRTLKGRENYVKYIMGGRVKKS